MCDTLIVFLKEFFLKVNFGKKQQTTKNHASLFLFPFFQGLLYAQDGVAKQEVRSSEGEPPDDNNFYIPSLPAGDSIKIVHLEKTTEPLVSL